MKSQKLPRLRYDEHDEYDDELMGWLGRQRWQRWQRWQGKRRPARRLYIDLTWTNWPSCTPNFVLKLRVDMFAGGSHGSQIKLFCLPFSLHLLFCVCARRAPASGAAGGILQANRTTTRQ